jgi:hypothetical protein
MFDDEGLSREFDFVSRGLRCIFGSCYRSQHVVPLESRNAAIPT